MRNFKDYNKSMIFNFQESPRFNYDNIKSIKSSEVSNNKINEGSGKTIFKNKLKQIDKDKFNRATRNEDLINRPNIQHKNTLHPKRNKKYYMNILDRIYQNDSHLNETNVKLKFNQNNLKTSSLIPFPKKFSKEKLIKEEDIIKEDLKKSKKNSKRKLSEDDGNKFDRIGNKKKTKKFNSSHLILKLKKKNNNNLKNTEIDKKRDFLKDEEIKTIIKKENENEEKSKDVKEENKSEKKNESIIEDKYIYQVNINEKENKMNDNNSYENKIIQIKKKDYNNEHNKSKVIVDINHVETKSKNEIVKYTNKEKEKGKKRRKGFPLCCCFIKDDSSDNE